MGASARRRDVEAALDGLGGNVVAIRGLRKTALAGLAAPAGGLGDTGYTFNSAVVHGGPADVLAAVTTAARGVAREVYGIVAACASVGLSVPPAHGTGTQEVLTAVLLARVARVAAAMASGEDAAPFALAVAGGEAGARAVRTRLSFSILLHLHAGALHAGGHGLHHRPAVRPLFRAA